MQGGMCRLLSAAALAALLGCATPGPSTAPQGSDAPVAPPRSVFLDAAAVRALYAGPHREEGVVLHGSHEGAPWTKWTKRDGTVELLAGHGLFADTGTLAIRGNTACWRWAHIDGGKESCLHLARVGADEYVTYDPDGSEGSHFRIVPQ
jgi:hypothetical protein